MEEKFPKTKMNQRSDNWKKVAQFIGKDDGKKSTMKRVLNDKSDKATKFMLAAKRATAIHQKYIFKTILKINLFLCSPHDKKCTRPRPSLRSLVFQAVEKNKQRISDAAIVRRVDVSQYKSPEDKREYRFGDSSL
jgi:hypothetical protein